MLLDVQRGFQLVQVVKVTDGQFGFLQLDFDQVALIAGQPQEDNDTTTRMHCKTELFGESNCVVAVISDFG